MQSLIGGAEASPMRLAKQALVGWHPRISPRLHTRPNPRTVFAAEVDTQQVRKRSFRSADHPASGMAELQAQASSFLSGDSASVSAFLTARRAEAAREEGTSAGTNDLAVPSTTELDRGA